MVHWRTQFQSSYFTLYKKTDFLVEATGFEPTTSWSRTKRATKLRYASIAVYIISKETLFCKRFYGAF